MTIGQGSLYQRLPEIYRIRDAEQLPVGQLRAFLASVEGLFGALEDNIGSLYNDLFIDTCDDWAVLYIADLLGTSHLSGDPRTLRADVADTIALRRRKGTRGAIERLAADLTGWPCRCVELFEHLAWSQHLNHQRPDAGGRPPYAEPSLTRFNVPRGGTLPVRDAAMLSLLGTPFDPFAYSADVKRADDGAVHVNLPNLAIFLWRLSAYRLPLVSPLAKGIGDLGPPPLGSNHARYAIRYDLDPLDRPLRLFNLFHQPGLDSTGAIEALTELDAVPGPIPYARLTTGSAAGNPIEYVSVHSFNASTAPPSDFTLSEAGLQLHLPRAAVLDGIAWTFRGDNLCAWETGLREPLGAHEIVIDPSIGRVVFGTAVVAERDALIETLGAVFRPPIFVSYTYGAVGPVGAHPVSRPPAPTELGKLPAGPPIPVTALGGPQLQTVLADLQNAGGVVIVELTDSLVHRLDPSALAGAVTENGLTSVRLQHSLLIRAASGERPTIELAAPLAFRPVLPADATVGNLLVRFEGIFFTRAAAMPPTAALIARAAVANLEFDGCTLDPGGYRLRNGTRAPLSPALHLSSGFGFAAQADVDAFAQTPRIVLQRSISGALLVDEDRYRLVVDASIVDAGQDVGDPTDAYAVTSATAPLTGWAAPMDVSGADFFGRVRVAAASGSGAVFVHRLEVWDNQHGCLKYSYFADEPNRLPPNFACVAAPDAELAFTSSWFGDPGYGQLACGTDFRIRNRGPGDNAMGAFGFLLEGHKWTNLGIRLREFMPVGVRPLPIAVT